MRTEMERVSTFGQRLRSVMLERGLNYAQLSQLVGQRPQTLNRYILGQREPRAEAAMEIAMRLGVSLYWLQGYDVPRTVQEGETGQILLPVLGVIRAGLPTLAAQEVLGYAAADDDASPKSDFYLRVSGDSMKNAGIQDGDLVQIHQQSTAENGQIVACIVNREDATLKRFYRQEGFVLLQPENPDYAPRIVPITDFDNGLSRIVGVATRLVRKL